MVRHTVVSAIEQREQQVSAAAGSATDVLTEYLRSYWKFIRSEPFAPLFRLIHAEIHNFPDLARFYAEEVVARSTAAAQHDRRPRHRVRRIPPDRPDRGRADADGAVRHARPLVHASRVLLGRCREERRPGARGVDRLLSSRPESPRAKRHRAHVYSMNAHSPSFSPPRRRAVGRRRAARVPRPLVVGAGPGATHAVARRRGAARRDADHRRAERAVSRAGGAGARQRNRSPRCSRRWTPRPTGRASRSTARRSASTFRRRPARGPFSIRTARSSAR